MIKDFIRQHWMLNYQKSWLAGDMTAGITVAVMLVPQGMAYALLAGLPPIIGLYASIIPLFIYALIGSSRQLAVGPAAMVALLIAAGVSQIAEPFSAEFVRISVTLALMVGVIQLLMGMARLGFLTNFISHPVVSGFTSAAAVIILVSQLTHLLGLELPRADSFIETLMQLSVHLNDVNGYTFALGGGTLVILWLSKRAHPLIPGALISVILATLVTWYLDLNELGVGIVGDIPKGLPTFSLPNTDYHTLIELLPFAITISLVGFMESYAVAQKYAVQKGYDLKPNQDLVGLGLANIVGAFFKIMPVTGGFGRTASNNNAGANTQLAAIITAVLIALTLLFFTPLFYYLPKSVLAAVIIMAVWTLIDLHEMKHLWLVKKEDFVLLMITMVSTWGIGIKEGISIGVIASTLWFVYKTTKPHVALLGKLPNREDYRNVERFSEAVQPENVLVMRFDAQFYYGNVSFFKNKLKALIEQAQPRGIQAIVIDASAVNQMDSSAATALQTLREEFKRRGYEMYFSGVKGPVRDVMKLCAFYDEDKVSDKQKRFYLNTHEAVLAAQKAMK